MAFRRLAFRRLGLRRMGLRRMGSALVIMSLAGTFSGFSQAQTTNAVDAGSKESARKAMDQGDSLAKAGKYAAALDAYRVADDIMQVPSTGIEVGRMYTQLGKYLEARDVLLRVTRYPVKPGEPEIFTASRREAQRMASEIEGKIATVTVEIGGINVGDTVDVFINELKIPAGSHKVPRSVNPGQVTVRAVASGYVNNQRTVAVAPGGTELVQLLLQRSATPGGGDHEQETTTEDGGVPFWSWIGFGVGAVGLAAGTAFGVMSLNKADELDTEFDCQDNVCPPEAAETKDKAVQLANASNVGFTLAAAGVVVGVVGLVVGSGPNEEAPPAAGAITITPFVGPASLGVVGRF